MSEGARPTVSVVIPALGAAEVVGAAIASARAQPGVDEVVVAAGDAATAVAARRVAADRPDADRTDADRTAADRPDADRPDADRTHREAAAWAPVVVVDNPTGGTSDGLNAAVAASRGEVIVRLDAHAELEAGYVATALDALARSGAANVGGLQVPHAERGFARAVAAAMTSPAGAGGAVYRRGGEPGPVDTVYLGVFRRSVLEAVGGFDPRFVRNQDAELNLRLRRAGHTVWFDPALAVRYRPRGDVAALARQYLGYGRWRRLTARVHPGSLAPRQLAPPVLVVGLAAAAATSLLLATPWPAAAAFGGYTLGLTAASVAAAPELRTAPATALALATMHLSWGVGFLLGPPRGVGPDDGPRR